MEQERQHDRDRVRLKQFKKRSRKTNKKSKRKRCTTSSDDDLSSASFGEESRDLESSERSVKAKRSDAFDDSSCEQGGKTTRVEYSDVSSDDFSAPEAGEIETDVTDTCGVASGFRNHGSSGSPGSDTVKNVIVNSCSIGKDITNTCSHDIQDTKKSSYDASFDKCSRATPPESDRRALGLGATVSSISGSSSRPKRKNSISSDTSMKKQQQRHHQRDNSHCQNSFKKGKILISEEENDEEKEGRNSGCTLPEASVSPELRDGVLLDVDEEEGEEDEEEENKMEYVRIRSSKEKDEIQEEGASGSAVISDRRRKKNKKDKKHKKSKRAKKRKKRLRNKSISSVETISESEDSLLESLTPPLKQSPVSGGGGSISYTPVHNDTSLTPVSPGNYQECLDSKSSFIVIMV